jgi:hypothetical protein
VTLRDRKHPRLTGASQNETPSVVLQEDGEEALEEPNRSVKSERPVSAPVGTDVGRPKRRGRLKSSWTVELPLSAERVLDVDVELRRKAPPPASTSWSSPAFATARASAASAASHSAASPTDFEGRVLREKERERNPNLARNSETKRTAAAISLSRSSPRQKMWASSWVKPRTRSRPVRTPLLS